MRLLAVVGGVFVVEIVVEKRAPDDAWYVLNFDGPPRIVASPIALWAQMAANLATAFRPDAIPPA